ncbi:MAG: hypothetical protein KGM99_20850, partial [Burkholderiales bacterium]|nr:hypothetical protein [Burkholderiales bacterium]
MRLKQTESSSDPFQDNQHLLRRQTWIVAALTLVAVTTMLLPLKQIFIPPPYYLPLHTLLEFVSVLFAFLVFAAVWHTPEKEVSTSLLLIAVALFASGWLDLAHALSYKGMPDLITPSGVEKGIAFWLSARLIVAVTLLFSSALPRLRAPRKWERISLLAGYTLVNIVVFWLIIFHERSLMPTFAAASGVTLFKTSAESAITLLLILAAWRYYRLARRSKNAFLPLMFSAVAIAAISEFFFTDYQLTSDAANALGHLCKLASYGLIYRAMFVVTIRKPYQELAA